MGAKLFGEFVGTAVLILLGDGVVATVLLKRSKGEGAGWVAITAGWAFAVIDAIFSKKVAAGGPVAGFHTKRRFKHSCGVRRAAGQAASALFGLSRRCGY